MFPYKNYFQINQKNYGNLLCIAENGILLPQNPLTLMLQPIRILDEIPRIR